MKRPTIADIAMRAGVTKAAVSFALNGQPGVSAATRERILAIADEIGFQPSSAARALTAGRAGAFGLIIDRPARMLGIEPFFMQVISGIQADLTQHHITLQFSMAEDPADEIELYRQWWAERRVDGVFVYDLRLDDTRIGALESLRMPAVVIGSPRGSSSLPAVWQDEHFVVSAIVGHLAELGHTRIARVGGLPQYWHTELRASAFTEVAAAFGVEVVQAEADYTAEHGAAATSSLLAEPLSGSGAPLPGASLSEASWSGSRPTAIVYDNDVMAVAGLSCATRLGFKVPSDVSIVSWDDSALCELTNPPLTAMGRDIAWIGATAARLLRSLVGGEEVASVKEAPPELVVRGSTGPA